MHALYQPFFMFSQINEVFSWKEIFHERDSNWISLVIMSFSSLLESPNFNSIANGKILAPSKLKVIADNKSKFDEMAELLLDGVENILRIGENAGYPYFLLFPQCLLRLLLQGH